jgi:hypothetical protein
MAVGSQRQAIQQPTEHRSRQRQAETPNRARLPHQPLETPAADRLQQLVALANNSPRTAQLRSLQELANNSPRATELRQLQALATSPKQSKEPEPAGTPQIAKPTPNRTGLPDALKSGIEALSGVSMDQVRVHYNSAQPARLNALAYAQGTDIHLAPGQERHLPHEAWHLVQQAQGRVRPTLQMKDGVQVNDDAGLEREADVMGSKALESGHRVAEAHRSISMPMETAQTIKGDATNCPDKNVANNGAAPLANGRGSAKRGGNEIQRMADQRPEAALQRQVQAWGDGRGVGGKGQESAMTGAASAHQAATASREETSQQRADRTRRTSADPQRAQQGTTAAAAATPAALDSLSRLQQLADASPQVAQLRRLQALADGRFAPVAQLAGGPEEEELVQGKFATAELQPQLQQAPRANNTGLPDQLKSSIESLSGLSLDHVRVHYNSAQPAQLNALAYAQGSEIHVAPGQEQNLPHEAWHVVQQAQGRVTPTMQMKDWVPVNDDAGLEHEADVMGERADAGVAQPCAQKARHDPYLQRKSGGVAQCLGRAAPEELLQGQIANVQRKPGPEGVSSMPLQPERNPTSDRPIQMVRPSDPVPSLNKQLEYRLLAMARKAKITPLRIYQAMLRHIGRSSEPLLPQPNQNLSEQDIENVVIAGIRRQSVEELKMLEDMEREQENPYLPEVKDYVWDIDNFKGKSLVRCVKILEPLRESCNHDLKKVITLNNDCIDRHFEAAEHATYTDTNQNDDPELRSAIENVAAGPKLIERAAEKVLHDRGQLKMRELNKDESKKMSDALKKMPTVIEMLNDSLGNGAAMDDLDSPFYSVEPDMYEKETLLENVQRALAKLADLVEPAKRIPKRHLPSLSINPDPESNFFDHIRRIDKKYRAAANREKKTIYVSNLTKIRTLVHEYGHHVEFYLPIDDWLDIQELLRMRHKGKELVSIYPNHSDKETRNESAYNAEMPATGLYSAKVYDDDSTEVMSMTLEYFSSPDTAKKMIEEDPLQSAVILRSVLPKEFHRYVSEELRKLLPSTGTSRLAEKSERERQIKDGAEEDRQRRLKNIKDRGGLIQGTEGNESIGNADL